MATPLYKVVRLPSVLAADAGNQQENELIDKTRSFRLEMLRTSPDKFAAVYDEEVLLPVERTRHRMSHPLGAHYVAIPTDRDSARLPLNEIEWVGAMVRYGPEIETRFKRAKFSFQPLEESDGREESVASLLESKAAVDKSLHYHHFGLFVSPIARGQGMGAALIKASIKDAGEFGVASGALEVRHTIALDTDNTNALRLYSKIGFVISEQGLYRPKIRKGVVQEEKGYTIMECLVTLAEVGVDQKQA